MSRIQIVTDNAALRKLMELLVEKTETVPSGIVLLDAADMARLPEFPKERTVLFTASADPFCLDNAHKTEAAAFWYLQPSVEALEEVLTAVARGERVFPQQPPVVRLGDAISSNLSVRELEVLRLVVAGETDAAMTDTEISNTLNIAVPTVKYQIQQLLFKTGFGNRTQLAVRAVFAGLIRP